MQCPTGLGKRQSRLPIPEETRAHGAHPDPAGSRLRGALTPGPSRAAALALHPPPRPAPPLARGRASMQMSGA